MFGAVSPVRAVQVSTSPRAPSCAHRWSGAGERRVPCGCDRDLRSPQAPVESISWGKAKTQRDTAHHRVLRRLREPVAVNSHTVFAFADKRTFSVIRFFC